jgi:hypothetical protein
VVVAGYRLIQVEGNPSDRSIVTMVVRRMSAAHGFDRL